MKRAVLYLRVSTVEQTTANQERELRQIADRMGCEIIKVYKDHGISGAKGRDKRPAFFDALCRDAAQRKFDRVMAWSVDRLGRSLQDLVGFLSELHAPANRPLSASAGLRHDNPCRQSHVPDDGRFC
jgi:DNA invertase Pin-like site-specific DNA recombinase